MIGQQQLEDALVRSLDLRCVGADDLSLGYGGHARHDHHRSARTLDLDEALAAHADRLHARVVAEARDVITAAIGGGDDPLALTRLDLAAVDRETNRVRVGGREILFGSGLGRAHDATPDAVTGIR